MQPAGIDIITKSRYLGYVYTIITDRTFVAVNQYFYNIVFYWNFDLKLLPVYNRPVDHPEKRRTHL